MALTAGTLSQVAVGSNSVTVASTAASGGAGPYTEAYYISTTTGFSPGAGNIVAGASGLSAVLPSLIPNTPYFVKVVYTDTGASNATVTSTQLALTTTAPSLSQNQFAQSPYLGQIDLMLDYNTVSGQIDISQATPLYAGAAVKLVPSTQPNSIPKLVGCTADTDEVYGFINFDIKTVSYVAGSLCEVSRNGNVMYLYATGAVIQGRQVTLDLTSPGSVGQAVSSSGANIVGWAQDGAAAAGALIRINLTCPSFLFA